MKHFVVTRKGQLLREMLKEIPDLNIFDSILITAKGNFFPPQAIQNLVRLRGEGTA